MGNFWQNIDFCNSVYPWRRRQQVIGTPFFLKNSDADAEEANKTTSTLPKKNPTSFSKVNKSREKIGSQFYSKGDKHKKIIDVLRTFQETICLSMSL